MTRKRGNNEGSIYKRKNGAWCAQVSIDGKRLTRTFNTQKECQVWIRKTIGRIDNGLTYKKANITLKEYMDRWLASSKSSLRPKTWHQYSQIARDYILPDLGAKKLIGLSPDIVQILYDKLIMREIGIRTIRLTHSVLRRCLNQAVKLGILQRNPATVVSPPKAEHKEMKFLDEAQVQRLLITAKEKNDRYAALYQLALSTGMRQGELLGLQWKDINWDRKTAHIQRQLNRVPGGALGFSQPKTKSSIRTISLGNTTIVILKEHQKQQLHEVSNMGTRWQEFDLVFPSTIGTPTNHSNLLRQSYKPILEDAGLPKIRFHDLRHTAASLMLNHGAPILIVSKRLGHAQPSITLDVYGHIMPNMQEEVANIMDDIITPIAILDNDRLQHVAAAV